MLPTSAFYQLAPSVVERIRNNYRTVERAHLPTRLTFLSNCGVDSDELDSLRAELLNDEEERIVAAWILIRLFHGEFFHASNALKAWLRRKPAARPEIKKLAVNFAETLLEADALMVRATSRLSADKGRDDIQYSACLAAPNCESFLYFG